MTLFLLYLWLKLDTFSTLLAVSAAILTFIPIVGLGVSGDEKKASYKPQEYRDAWAITFVWWKKIAQRAWITAAVFAFVAFALPSQRQGAYLIAGYAGLKLAETPEMGKLTELVRLKVGNYLDDELKSAKAQAVDAVASAVSK